MYLVRGWTGEYDDCYSWDVGLFRSEDEALEYAAKLNLFCREQGCFDDGITSHTKKHYVGDIACPLDSNFHSDYTGTEYRVVTIPVLGG